MIEKGEYKILRYLSWSINSAGFFVAVLLLWWLVLSGYWGAKNLDNHTIKCLYIKRKSKHRVLMISVKFRTLTKETVMFTLLGFFALFVTISYFLVLGGFVKDGKSFIQKITPFRLLIASTVSLGGLFIGVYLAIQIGKSLPTYQRKISYSEMEILIDGSDDVFIAAEYKPAFVNGWHNTIAIPTNNGMYKITKKIIAIKK